MGLRDFAPQLTPDEGTVGGPGPTRSTYATDPNPPSTLGYIANVIGGGIKDTLTAPLPRAITDEAGYTHYNGMEIPPGGRAATPGEQLKGVADYAGMSVYGRGGFGQEPFSKVMEGGKPIRVYRGTRKVYDVEDPSEWKSGGLFGPGAYHTENPHVASGYTGNTGNPTPTATSQLVYESLEHSVRYNKTELARAQAELEGLRNPNRQPVYDPAKWAAYWRDRVAELNSNTDLGGSLRRSLIADAKRQLKSSEAEIAEQARTLPGKLQKAQEQVDFWQRQTNRVEAELLALEREAPNVRVNYLDIINPFDADTGTIAVKPLLKLVKESLRAAGRNPDPNLTRLRDRLSGWTVPEGVTYEMVKDLVGGRWANNFLKRMGYDGITHTGGIISGGQRHRVWINFDPKQEHPGYTPMEQLP